MINLKGDLKKFEEGIAAAEKVLAGLRVEHGKSAEMLTSCYYCGADAYAMELLFLLQDGTIIPQCRRCYKSAVRRAIFRVIKRLRALL